MSATARTAVYEAIRQRRDDPESAGQEPFAVAVFDVLQTHLPRVALADLVQPRVTVVGLGADEIAASRGGLFWAEQPVQVALQAKVDPHDDEHLDLLTQFFEELRQTARTLRMRGLAWLRTEALKDSNRTPYHFVRLREEHTFEAIFTAIYRYGTT